MSDSRNNFTPEPDLDEIMQKIREEVAKRKVLSQREKSSGHFEKPSVGTKGGSVISKILLAFGTRNAAFIKKIPVIRNVAEKYYWRLSNKLTYPVTGLEASGTVGPCLEDMVNYRIFLQEIGHHGLKGRIKRIIFGLIGFFAWWQEQVNNALYGELIRLRKLAEVQGKTIKGMDDELSRTRQQAESLARTIKDMESMLAVLNKTGDALYRELISQRLSFSESDKAMETSLNYKIGEMTARLREQVDRLDARVVEQEKKLASHLDETRKYVSDAEE